MIIEAELHFELLNQIGSGGEGIVRRAYDRQMNATLAVKIIPVKSFNVDAYFEEARKLYLSRHHNVVPVQYACKKDQDVYMAMPYHQRGSIEDMMKKRHLTSREVIRYSLHFLSGLNNIHTKGLIHFDIKPANFLISDSDVALLSDFGVAQHMQSYGFATVSDTTKLYAPPEYFIQSSQHNLKFDIYQAGISMYRMCNGDQMYLQQVIDASKVNGKKDNQHYIDTLIAGKFMKNPPFLPHVPMSLRKIIRKAIKPDPDKRYDSVLSMLNALSQIDDANNWQFDAKDEKTHFWTQDVYCVSAIKNGTTWTTNALKNGRRNRSFCKSGLTDDSKESLLTDCLNSKW